MPSLSWPSWSKKDPPVSSIAGTRGTPQPPSINVPPYTPGPEGSSSGNGYPTSVASTAQTGPYRTSSPAANSYSSQNSATSGNFYTGPYATGSATPGATFA